MAVVVGAAAARAPEAAEAAALAVWEQVVLAPDWTTDARVTEVASVVQMALGHSAAPAVRTGLARATPALVRAMLAAFAHFDPRALPTFEAARGLSALLADIVFLSK